MKVTIVPYKQQKAAPRLTKTMEKVAATYRKKE